MNDVNEHEIKGRAHHAWIKAKQLQDVVGGIWQEVSCIESLDDFACRGEAEEAIELAKQAIALLQPLADLLLPNEKGSEET